MFLTIDDSRLPFPVSSSGCSGWETVELPMPISFFMVKMAVKDEMKLVNKTFFLASIEQLLSLIEIEKSGYLNIKYAFYMCPKHVSGGDDWEMYKLSKIYRSTEPRHNAQICHVYEIVSGRRFVDSTFGTTIEKLSELTPLYTFH